MGPATHLILGFLGRFIFVYALFTGLWFSVDTHYAQAFRALGNLILGDLGTQGIVHFLPLEVDAKTEHKDTALLLTTQANLAQQQVELSWVIVSSRDSAYIPTVLLIALILASPISGLRKQLALFHGLILIHVFIGLRLLVAIAYAFSHNPNLAMLRLTPFWQTLLDIAAQVFTEYIGILYIMPVFIWLLVTLRQSDWQQLKPLCLTDP